MKLWAQLSFVKVWPSWSRSLKGQGCITVPHCLVTNGFCLLVRPNVWRLFLPFTTPGLENSFYWDCLRISRLHNYPSIDFMYLNFLLFGLWSEIILSPCCQTFNCQTFADLPANRLQKLNDNKLSNYSEATFTNKMPEIANKFLLNNSAAEEDIASCLLDSFRENSIMILELFEQKTSVKRSRKPMT